MNVRKSVSATRLTQAGVRTVRKLARFATPMETLESRVLMSAATLATPTAVTATATSPASVSLSWTESTPTAGGYAVLRSTNGGEFATIGKITTGATKTFSDTTVQSNKSYSYKVQAVAAGKTSPVSAPTVVKTPLVAPTAVTATLQEHKIAIGWTGNDTTATGYHVLRSTNGGAFTNFADVTSRTITTATDTTVVSGQAYRYEVQAYTTTNTSAVTAPVTLAMPLAAPSGLSAATSTSSMVHVAWINNDTSTTGYLVLRSTDGTHFTTLSTITTASAVSIDDKSVLPFTTYYYRLEATTVSVVSAVSNTATAKTTLATPTAAGFSTVAANAISMKWADTDPAAQGYYVLRSDGGAFTQVALITSNKTVSFTDTTVRANRTYSYEVQAYNGTSTSATTAAITLTTLLASPTALSATTLSGTSVQLTWTGNDSAATGYVVLRSIDGKAFVNGATISSGSAGSFVDTVASGHMYCYSLVATSDHNSSAMISPSTTVTPVVAPGSVTATSLSATSVRVNWVNRDPSATSYQVFRSVNGGAYTLLSTLTSATANTVTDTTALSNHTYSYRVQASNGIFASSSQSDAATATTPMLAPTKLTATVTGGWINLAWTNTDTTATGYVVLRSTDGIIYTQLATLTSGGTTSYADTTVTAGQKYYYQVQATAGSAASAVSAAASATVSTAPTTTSTVAITTRYGNELVITATGASDSIFISQSGTTLTIVADGKTSTSPVPAAGVFVYVRGGADGINVDQSVNCRVTIETVDGGTDDIVSAGTNVSAWVDSNDVYTGSGTVHAVGSFVGGVAKTVGAALANPKDAGKTIKMTTSLWGTGPVAGDINQGGVGDCYFLSSLAAFAGVKPSVLQESAVDMGDGTYTVQFYSQNKPVFIRVSNDISTGAYWGYGFARPGSSGDVWALVMEKAFADFRTGANTYASTSSGWMGEVYADLGQANTSFGMSGATESSFYSMVSTDLATGKAVTLGTSNAPTLVSGHAYTLVSCGIDANGVTSYVVRNPWGVSGDSLENSQGYATLTYAQMKANFIDGCQAL